MRDFFTVIQVGIIESDRPHQIHWDDDTYDPVPEGFSYPLDQRFKASVTRNFVLADWREEKIIGISDIIPYQYANPSKEEIDDLMSQIRGTGDLPIVTLE